MPEDQISPKRTYLQGWRELGSYEHVLPLQRTRLSSQHPHGSLKWSLALVLGSLVPTPGLQGHQVYTECTYVSAGKRHTHNKNEEVFNLKSQYI